MPYLKNPDSWRVRKRLGWLSRLLCLFGRHRYFYSSVSNKPLKCAICGHRTKHYPHYNI
jgi:hypothetical protein